MESRDDQLHEQVRAALRSADVFSIFFVRIGQSMIVDTRTDGAIGPAVMLDQIVASPRDRLESMRKLRPGMPLPERMTLAPWTATVRDFETSGMLESLLERCRFAGGEQLSDDALKSYHRLVKMERRFLRDLVRGVGMKTIWSRGNSSSSAN
jgi:hypothetical protein